MNFIELTRNRYSVRSFSKEAVNQNLLDCVLEAARTAPTAVNYQPQRIIVVQSEEGLHKIQACTKYHFYAPLVLILCYDTDISWKRKDGKDYGEIDAAIAGTQMMLQAAELGLGSTWVGVFDAARIKESFGLPAQYEPIGIFPMGYPAEDAQPSPMHERRNPIEDMVFYETVSK